MTADNTKTDDLFRPSVFTSVRIASYLATLITTRFCSLIGNTCSVSPL